MKKTFIMSVAISLSACGGSESESTLTTTSVTPIPTVTPSATPTPTVTPTPTITPTVTPTPTDTPSPTITPTPTIEADILNVWIINDTAELSAYVDGGVTQVNVQNVEEELISGINYAAVTASGIPNYEVLMTTGLVDWLNNRPKATSDFDNGTTTAVAGVLYNFGADLGYINNQCNEGEGQGYWPPGPACPSDISRTGYFPIDASPNSSDCEMGANTIGYAVNGVAIFGWYDGQSYNSAGDWSNLASVAEAYDVDICGGHAAGTTYHHHHYSDCWARVAGEDYEGHSEIYGYAADGYAVYGPYEDTGELAQSCWKKRNYSVGPTDEGYGCVGFNGAVEGERNCVLVDEYDPSQGVEAANSDGPTTSDTVTSLSSNTFNTTSGFYKQDYYFDSACSDSGDSALDEHNGHSDDIRGYHYHLSLETESQADDVPVTPTYPFTFGPRFAGELADNAVASCSTGDTAPGGPPGGRP